MTKPMLRRTLGNKKLVKNLSLHEQVVALLLKDGRPMHRIAASIGNKPTVQTLYNWTNGYYATGRGKKLRLGEGRTSNLEIVANYYGYRLTMRRK